MSRWRVALATAAVLCLCAVPARAQQTSSDSRLWLAAGGTWTTLLGDCTNCDIEHYLHTGGLLIDAGIAINPRTTLGGELFWVPATLTTGDHIRVSFLLAAAEFRPWRRHGFLIKTGAGMAFLTNWLDVLDDTEPPIRSKAFALALGAGWEWRLAGRFGAQVFGSQYATALGDLETSGQTIENVMGNFWSAGAAIVIR